MCFWILPIIQIPLKTPQMCNLDVTLTLCDFVSLDKPDYLAMHGTIVCPHYGHVCVGMRTVLTYSWVYSLIEIIFEANQTFVLTDLEINGPNPYFQPLCWLHSNNWKPVTKISWQTIWLTDFNFHQSLLDGLALFFEHWYSICTCHTEWSSFMFTLMGWLKGDINPTGGGREVHSGVILNKPRRV